MALAIHKPGQGYWTRVLTAAGIGVLTLAGAGWLFEQFAVVTADYRIYIQWAAVIVLVGGMGVVSFWLLNKPRVVDFMIATEAEMRKVSWPTRRELILSTVVVIWGTFLMAMALFVVDVVFVYLFQAMGVLEKGVS